MGVHGVVVGRLFWMLISLGGWCWEMRNSIGIHPSHSCWAFCVPPDSHAYSISKPVVSGAVLFYYYCWSKIRHMHAKVTKDRWAKPCDMATSVFYLESTPPKERGEGRRCIQAYISHSICVFAIKLISLPSLLVLQSICKVNVNELLLFKYNFTEEM